MNINIIDPLTYPGWDSMLLRNNDYSFFHSTFWARVLKETYRYDPLYFVSFQGTQLVLLIPFMEVSSFVTGKRGVSLPFADQCAPHVARKELLPEAVQYITSYGKMAGWKYVEWRDSSYFADITTSSERYITHDINLVGTESDLFSRLRESNRRNIKKASREGVQVAVTQSLDSVKSFYRLHCMTRKRHGLPPQPFVFFKSIFDNVISAGQGIIVSALYSGDIIAASIYLHFGTKALFKYGASDVKHQGLRPNNLVMWEAIKWYRDHNFISLNLGRTELENQGLLQFKRMWAPTESTLDYYRYDIRKKVFLIKDFSSKGSKIIRPLFARAPITILRIIGSLAYRHIG
jgi:hypothetical protein